MGVIHGCRTVGAQMVERGSGQIVNIASAAAFVPLRSAPAYAVTKSAVLMLSECLRIELASSGVGVSAICPIVIRTNIARHARVAGVDADVETRFVEAGARLQRFAWPGPDKVARAVTRAARHDWAIVPVNPDAWLTYLVSRASPGVVRSLARAASFDVMLRGAMRLLET
jgi:short-subunit dehydrogenase